MRPSRFNVEDIYKIRDKYIRGEPVTDIAIEYGVNHTTIYYWCGRKKIKPSISVDISKRKIVQHRSPKSVVKDYQYYVKNYSFYPRKAL